MKKFLPKLMTIVVMIVFAISLTGCRNFLARVPSPSPSQSPSPSPFGGSFCIEIDGVDYMQSKETPIVFEVSTYEYVSINIYDEETDDNEHNKIDFNCNVSGTLLEHAYTIRNGQEVAYKVHFTELCNNGEFEITYKEETITLKFKVVDYDFEGRGHVKLTSMEMLDEYPEFKEMLTSLKQHTVGFPREVLKANKGVVDFGEDVEASDQDENYASTDYTRYFSDSIYYPQKFNMGRKNPVSSVRMSFRSTDANYSVENLRSRIDRFSLNYSVIDPCCSNPQYPLQYMGFQVKHKNFVDYDFTFKEVAPNQHRIWLERYQDKFYKCDLGAIKLYVIAFTETNGDTRIEACGYCDNYFYYTYASYYY